MNRTKIEWTDYTWNPIVGCNHGCWYCYARKLAQRFPKKFPNGFEPTFHPERLKEPYELKKPSKIFVCSIADIFAPWTPEVWRDAVLDAIFKCPIKHTFQLLTKNPEEIPDIYFPGNVWIGTTVTGENGDWRNIEQLSRVRAKIRFVSFEPLLGSIPSSVINSALAWVVIGKLTGSRKVKLNPVWVYQIVQEAEFWKIPVFLKDNLLKEFPFPRIQEYPT